MSDPARDEPRETHVSETRESAELQLELDAIHNALGTIAAANASPYVGTDERRRMIREAADRAGAALREVERHA